MAQEIRNLIRKMSAANAGWGSPRIMGELAKLGISVSKSTVEKYMVRARKPPSPTWRAFLANGPTPRPVQGPEHGNVLEVPEAGGLHRHYERLAA